MRYIGSAMEKLSNTVATVRANHRKLLLVDKLVDDLSKVTEHNARADWWGREQRNGEVELKR